jgi:tetratricopeptide (TPR) repeat protein
MHQDRPETTQQALTVVIARFDQKVGADHPQYLRASYNICWSFVQRGQYNKAKDRLQGLLAVYERLAGIDHIYSRQALYALAQVYSAQGLLISARKTLEELLCRIQCPFGTDISTSIVTIEAHRMLAALYGRQSNPEQMRNILASALVSGQQLLGPEHPIVLLVKHDLEDISNWLNVYSSQGYTM